jgi:NAD(P)-dependent dehydrogenase (short-subunit alcohol dehydrogenase family)
MNLFSLENKVAIVTGAAGLLGQAHCAALAGAGANVVVADLNETLCTELAIALGSGHLAVKLDVTNSESIQQAKEIILEKYGSIDVLVNNAAINDMFENPLLGAKQSMFEHYPLEMFNKSLDVNVTGMFLCSQILGTVMAEQRSGSIINIASTYGIVAPDQSLYINKQ